MVNKQNRPPRKETCQLVKDLLHLGGIIFVPGMYLPKNIQNYELCLTGVKSISYPCCPRRCKHVEGAKFLVRVGHEHPGTTRVVTRLFKAENPITPDGFRRIHLDVENGHWFRFVAEHILTTRNPVGDVKSQEALARLRGAKQHDHAWTRYQSLN